jgi:hypothetical protein
MNRMRFRIASVLLGLLVTLGGTVAIRAQCGTGCNYGTYQGCYIIESSCPEGDECEQDRCLDDNCEGVINLYNYCISTEFACHYPSCTYDAFCGCTG